MTELLQATIVTVLYLVFVAVALTLVAAVIVSLVALAKPHVSGIVTRWTDWLEERWDA